MSQKYAMVKSGIVQSTLVADNEAMAARNTPAGTTRVACSPAVEPGWSYANSTFTAPVIAAKTADELLEGMLDVIDTEREQLMMKHMSSGGAKKYEYAEKALEYRDYSSLSVAAITTLLLPANAATTALRFPWAAAEALDTGDTIAIVMARFKSGIEASAAPGQKLAARAQKLKRALRAAAPAQREAIFAARTWPTT